MERRRGLLGRGKSFVDVFVVVDVVVSGVGAKPSSSRVKAGDSDNASASAPEAKKVPCSRAHRLR